MGNVYCALLSWLAAKNEGGEWILRIEDLDPQRSRMEYAEQIEQDLKWLGLDAGQCLAVEDSPTGLQAAKAAGLQVVGYTGGSIRQDTSRADWTAASFDAIARLLETLAPNDGRTAK